MRKFELVLFLLIFISSALEANDFRDDVAFSKLKQHILLNQNEGAWEYTNSLQNEYLGDTEFDFLYGIVALRVNENERAVFAFERVTANKPGWLDAQYYLALSYFKTNNFHAVLAVVDDMTENDIDSVPLKESVNKLKEAATSRLDKQLLYVQQSINVNAGYDSNINAGTREDSIYLPFLNQDILLSESSRENSDNYLSATYQLNGSQVLDQKSKIIFSAAGQLHYFINESDFNRLLITTNAEYQKNLDLLTASVGIRAKPFWLNDSFYRTQYGAFFKLSKIIEQQWFISSEVYLGNTKNDINKLLDSKDKSVDVSVSFIRKKWRHSLSFQYFDEKSRFEESQHNNREINSITASSQWAISHKWLASVMASFQHQRYQYEHPFFFEKRSDDMWLFGTSIQYKQSETMSYQLNANIQDKDSNLALFSYQRADVSLSARMSF